MNEADDVSVGPIVTSAIGSHVTGEIHHFNRPQLTSIKVADGFAGVMGPTPAGARTSVRTARLLSPATALVSRTLWLTAGDHEPGKWKWKNLHANASGEIAADEKYSSVSCCWLLGCDEEFRWSLTSYEFLKSYLGRVLLNACWAWRWGEKKHFISFNLSPNLLKLIKFGVMAQNDEHKILD